jgi:hypothetical protein
MPDKPKLILQIDCDSEYVMQKHYGIPKQQGHTYYSALDIYIEKFREAKLKSTLFVVGNDMENKNLHPYIFNAINNNNEIANHSYDHPNRFSEITDERFRIEVQKTNDAVHSAFGLKCKGFRAPNFDINPSHIKILKQEGFHYDCSILSTPYLPIIKLLKGTDVKKSGYMGKLHLAPRRPYIPCENKIWKSAKSGYNNSIIEIPITTFPYLKFPCHFSHLLAASPKIAVLIMTTLIKWHIKRNEPLIFIFHLTDLVDNKFLFGTELKHYKSLKERLFLLDKFIEMVSNSFDSLTTSEYCDLLKAGAK